MAHKWTDDEVCMLGKVTDAKLAEHIRITARAVQAARQARGIPAYTRPVGGSKIANADKIAELAQKIVKICGK